MARSSHFAGLCRGPVMRLPPELLWPLAGWLDSSPSPTLLNRPARSQNHAAPRPSIGWHYLGEVRAASFCSGSPLQANHGQRRILQAGHQASSGRPPPGRPGLPSLHALHPHPPTQTHKSPAEAASDFMPPCSTFLHRDQPLVSCFLGASPSRIVPGCCRRSILQRLPRLHSIAPVAPRRLPASKLISRLPRAPPPSAPSFPAIACRPTGSLFLRGQVKKRTPRWSGQN